MRGSYWPSTLQAFQRKLLNYLVDVLIFSSCSLTDSTVGLRYTHIFSYDLYIPYLYLMFDCWLLVGIKYCLSHVFIPCLFSDPSSGAQTDKCSLWCLSVVIRYHDSSLSLRALVVCCHAAAGGRYCRLLSFCCHTDVQQLSAPPSCCHQAGVEVTHLLQAAETL